MVGRQFHHRVIVVLGPFFLFFLLSQASSCAVQPEESTGSDLAASIGGPIVNVIDTTQNGHQITLTRPHLGPVPTKYMGRNVWHVNLHLRPEGSTNDKHNFHIAWCRAGGSQCVPAPGQMICLYVSDTAGRRAGKATVILDQCFDRISPSEIYDTLKQSLEASIGFGLSAIVGIGALLREILLPHWRMATESPQEPPLNDGVETL